MGGGVHRGGGGGPETFRGTGYSFCEEECRSGRDGGGERAAGKNSSAARYIGFHKAAFAEKKKKRRATEKQRIKKKKKKRKRKKVRGMKGKRKERFEFGRIQRATAGGGGGGILSKEDVLAEKVSAGKNGKRFFRMDNLVLKRGHGEKEERSRSCGKKETMLEGRVGGARPPRPLLRKDRRTAARRDKEPGKKRKDLRGRRGGDNKESFRNHLGARILSRTHSDK